MRGRRGVAALAAVLCVAAGVLTGNSLAGADDATTIDVDAEAVSITSDGECSLAEAITNLGVRGQAWTDCASGAGVTVIHLPAGTYVLTADLPVVTQSVTFKGEGANSTIIDGGSARRILNAQGPTALTIDGLTLRHGKSGLGAGLYAYNEPDTLVLTIRNSSFDDNQSTADGGAVYFSGGRLNITGSSFSGNVAAKNGGAIGLPGGDTLVSISNSTFAHNTAKYGGVIAAHDGSWDDPVTIVNSTLVGNDAATNNTGLASAIKTVVIANSIIARDGALKAACVTGNDAFAVHSGHSLTDDSSCTTRYFTVVSALDLGTAGLHGGTTSNFEPPAESPAIDAGDDATCAAAPVSGTDQRGFPRSGQGEHCDIGAIEVQATAGEPEGALISASKSVTGDFAPGGEATYTVTLANDGPGAQADNAGHEFVDVLPAGVTLVSAEASLGTITPDSSANTVYWDGEIGAGGSAAITVTATVEGDIGDTVANQATVKYDADGDGSNDTTALSDDPATDEPGDATVFTVTAPDVRVTKTVTTEGPYRPGSTIGYRVVISNKGNGVATGVTLMDTMGTNLNLVPASVDTSAGTVGPGVTDAYLEIDIGGIEPGASVTVDFDAVVAAPVAAGTTDVRNQATVHGTNFDDVLSDDDDDATDGIAPTVSLVQTSPGLDIDVTGDLAAEPGDVVTYALGYANTGDIGIDDVVIAADVPAGTQFNAANSTSGWSCESSGDDVVCELSLGALNGGASGTVWFAVALDDGIAAETMTVAAGISSGDVLAGASATTAIVRPDIAAVMRGPATANPSGEVHYDVTVTNTGSAIAEDVIIESTLPGELVFSPGGDCTATGQVVTCSVGNLGATDGTATLTIDAAVAEDVADGSSLSVSGSVTWALGTPIQTNTIITSVQAIDLTAFVDGTTAGAPGESVVLSVNYANQGGATATGVWIEADLPPGIGLVSLLSDPGWDCTSNVCSVSVGKLSPGGGASALALSIGDVDPSLESVSIKLTIGDDGEHGPDADASDNVTMALITIVRPDLAATLGGPEGTTPGGSFTYEATVANNGTAGVAATVLTDLLPDGLTFDDATSSPQCSAVAQTVSCAVGALGADETATVTIGVLAELRLRDADTLSNYVTVEQATGEAVTGNNTSSTITTSVAAADLGLTVTGGESARPGAGVMYHVEVGNAGSLSASGTWVVVGLADGLTFAPHDSSTGCTRTGETVTCSVTETIVAGGSAGFDIAAVLPDDVSDGTMLGSHITTASGSPESTSTLVDNAADATTTVEYLLSVDASVTGPADATTADALAYTFTLSNTGDDASIALAVTIGDGLAVDGVSPDGGITCEALDPATNVVACSGTLSREAVASVAVSVHLDGTRLDTAVNLGVAGHAFTGESDARVQDQQFAAAAQISATRTVAVGLTAQASPQRPMPASEVTYTIAAENAGDQLDGVQLTMTLPGGVVFKGVTSDGGMSCVGGQVTTCSTGAAGWGDGARATITIAGRISPDAGAGSALVLVATLAHSSGAISVSAAALVASPPPDIVIPIGPLPSAGDEQTHTYHLGFRWTLITWVGADGASPGETVDPGDDEVAGVLAAIYTWDPEANQWRGYFGREAPVNGANDLDALRFGHVYWVAIDGATEAEWTVPLGGAAR